MEDNYLDKKLKDILENPPPFEPDIAAISDMKRRLEQSESKKTKPIFVWWWLFPLLLLPLFGGLVIFFKNYKNLNDKVDELTIQLKDYQENTAAIKNITYHYDTIVNTIYKDVIVERRFEKSTSYPFYQRAYQLPYLSNINLSKSSSLTDFLFSTHQNQLFQKGAYFSNWGRLDTEDSPEKTENSLARFIQNQPIDRVGFKPINSFYGKEDLSEKLNDSDWKPFERNVNPLLYFIPKGVNFGAKFTPAAFGKANERSINPNVLGINASLEFYEGIEMEVGFERLGFGFEIKNQAEIQAYPMVAPDNTNDFLKELKGSFTYIQIPILLKKYFRQDKDFQPLFGVGFTAQKATKQSFKYEFIDDLTNLEYERSLSLNQGDFTMNNLRTMVGLRFKFWKNLSAQSNIVYHHSFDKGAGEYFKINYWGADVGLRYHFN
jgi:hypothetical protein